MDGGNRDDWGFYNAFQPAARARLLSNLVTFHALSRQTGKSELLGSGFVIAARSGHALCVTAAHVLQDLHRVFDIPSGRTPGVAPGFEISRGLPEELKRAMKEGYVRASALVGNTVAAPTFTEAYWSNELDVGVVGLASNIYQDGHMTLDLNSDTFGPGTPVLALRCYDGLAERVRRGKMRLSFLPTLEGRGGYVRTVEQHRRMVTCPAYELTLSIPHGMSGGPVMLAPVMDGPMQVMAFASFDHSGPKEVDDPSVRGAGTAIPIAAAYVLGHFIGDDLPLLTYARNRRILDHGSQWPQFDINVTDGTIFLKRRDRR